MASIMAYYDLLYQELTKTHDIYIVYCIDGRRKAGDAPGHKIVVAVCVCVFVVVVVVVVVAVGGGGGGGGYSYDTVCGAENGHFSCPTETAPQDITTSIKSSISANPSFLESMPPSC